MAAVHGFRVGVVGRQLQDDLAAIVEDEAAILLQRQVGRELARPPQAAGEQQRRGDREQASWSNDA